MSNIEDATNIVLWHLVCACAGLILIKFNIYNCILRAKFALKIYNCKIFLRIIDNTTPR